MKIKTSVGAYSSVVGGGIIIKDEEGKVIGQLGLMGFHTEGDVKRYTGELLHLLSRAINNAEISVEFK